MTEAQLWRKVRDGLRRVDPDKVSLQLTRLENLVGRSMPDVNVFWKGREAWVELKVARPWAVKFQPGQVPWLENRSLANGRAFVLVWVEGNESLQLFAGSESGKLAEKGARGWCASATSHLARAAYNARRINWRDLLHKITWEARP